MALLIFGLLLWCGMHFVPTLAPRLKSAVMTRVGTNGYKGLFALTVFAGLACIIFGWRSTTPQLFYVLPLGFRHFGYLLILIAFIIIGAAHYPSRIKRAIPHPMLTGVALWAFTHLLLNGDSRSMVLFGTLLVWSILEILLISRRDGKVTTPASPPWKVEFVGLFISVLIFLALAFFHRYFTGIPIINL